MCLELIFVHGFAESRNDFEVANLVHHILVGCVRVSDGLQQVQPPGQLLSLCQLLRHVLVDALFGLYYRCTVVVNEVGTFVHVAENLLYQLTLYRLFEWVRLPSKLHKKHVSKP